MFDVVWSESQNKWVARAAYLRFVGDVFHQKNLSETKAIAMAESVNSRPTYPPSTLRSAHL